MSLRPLRRLVKRVERQLEREGVGIVTHNVIMRQFIVAAPLKKSAYYERETVRDFVNRRAKRLPLALRTQVLEGDPAAVEVARDYLLERGAKFQDSFKLYLIDQLTRKLGEGERERVIKMVKSSVPGVLCRANDLVDYHVLDGDLVLIGDGWVEFCHEVRTFRPLDVKTSNLQAVDGHMELWPIDRVAAVLPMLAYGEVRVHGQPWFPAVHVARRR